MVSKSDSVNMDVGPPRKVDCEISYRLERGTKYSYKGVETFP